MAGGRVRILKFFGTCRPIFFPRLDDCHCDRIHSSLTAVLYFDNGYVGKQSVAWKEYCVEHWLKELQESMDRCTGGRDMSEILLTSHYLCITEH